MNEIQEIIRTVEATTAPLYLATVVDVVGSAYRRPTARMLILPDGTHVGSISGGCLERDLCRAAATLTQDGPRLVSFDTREDSTNFNPRYNVGCRGIIYVLVQRVTRDNNCPTTRLSQIIETGQSTVVATVYVADGEIGDYEVGNQYTDLKACIAAANRGTAAKFQEQMTEHWQRVGECGVATCCEVTFPAGSARLLLERVTPPKPLWIFGAGDDAMPLAVIADQLGWAVTTIDHRPSLLTASRFSKCRRICQPWPNVQDHLHPTTDVAAVLMTHGFNADKLLLSWLLSANISYVGVLGPKARMGRIMQELYAAGKLPSPESLDRLHNPVGLDIGAAASAEIAVSITAEIIAAQNERDGTSLHLRHEPIHQPVRHVVIDARTENSGRTRPHASNHVAIVLAAGESKRLGQPKQLLRHRGKSLIAHSVDMAKRAGSDEVIVVTGANYEEIQPHMQGTQCRLLYHAGWKQGMGSSLSFGVQFALSQPQSDRPILILLCDQPFIPAAHLESLVASVKAHDTIAATKYPDESVGIPACFPARYGEALLRCSGQSGAKRLIESEAVQLVECPEADRDIDVAADIKLLDP